MNPRACTKIVATVGPASSSPEMLRNLIKAGVDVFRLNMAHGSQPDHLELVTRIRECSQQLDQPVGILVDLAGPKIRLGDLPEPVECQVDDQLTFVREASAATPGQLTSSYRELIEELRVGNRVVLADGTICLEVVETRPESATCRVTSAGLLRSRQGINLPGVQLSVRSLTPVDRDNAVWAADAGADFISLSFVRTPEDLIELRELVRERGSQALIIGKIEKREALENLEAIVAASDGIMVARGDLGVEIDVAETPVAQKRIIQICQSQARPVIVATQMLESMHHSRRPTRAEATDVANAIIDGADACMLSGETAIGQYPCEAVNTMNDIMLATERMLHSNPALPPPDHAAIDVHPVTSAVVHAAYALERTLAPKLVVVVTRSGITGRIKAKLRTAVPTVGVSSSEATLRQLNLSWGIIPVRHAPVEKPAELRTFIDDWGRQGGLLQDGDQVVYITGSGLVEGAHNLLVVHEVLPAD